MQIIKLCQWCIIHNRIVSLPCQWCFVHNQSNFSACRVIVVSLIPTNALVGELPISEPPISAHALVGMTPQLQGRQRNYTLLIVKNTPFGLNIFD